MARPKSIVTKAELARVLKLSKARITQIYRMEGFPARPDGRVDKSKAVAWYEASGLRQVTKSGPRPAAVSESRNSSESQDDSLAIDRAADGPSKLDLEKQKLVEEVEALRLKNEKERGSLVRADEVYAATAQRAEAERESLLNWPSQVSAGLAARLGVEEREVFVALTSEVRNHLERRSRQPLTSERADGK